MNTKTTAHTPGPWHVKASNGSPAHGYGHKATGPSVSVEAAHGSTVARMVLRANYDNLEQAEANARLIAAAPQLLEALQAMVSPYTHGGEVKVFTDLPPALQERLTLARAALAQVQGN